MIKTINITLKIEDSELLQFETFLNEHLEVVSLRVLPNTEKLYEKDMTFQKLVKAVKKAQVIRDIYINENHDKL